MSVGPLVIIDGHNLFIRNYCVNPMMDTNGARCGGTIGTIQSVKKLINDLRPSNILVVWDGEGGSQRRKSIYKAYKEGRTIRMNKEYDFGESPEDGLENMRAQRQAAADYLALLGVPQVRADGVEADDLMAYVAGKMDHEGGCIIVTTDKDLLQLVRSIGQEHLDDCLKGNFCSLCEAPNRSCLNCVSNCGCPVSSEVKILSPIKRKTYDRQTFISEYGVLPENFRLVKALTGDKSDNIEGIKGFGDKTVLRLFPVLGERRITATELMAAAEGLEGVLGERLITQKDRFWENLQLVDLSDPMLSATAARQARDAMYRDIGCRELDLRLRMSKDGVSVPDDKLVQPFREMVLKRRRMLELRKNNVEVEQELQDPEEIKSE